MTGGVELRQSEPQSPDTRAFLAREQQLLIGGDWLAASGGSFETRDPATQHVLSHIPRATLRDADDAIASAKQSFDRATWRGLPAAHRAQVLWQVATLIDQHADTLAELETLNQGKTWATSRFAEVPAAAEQFRYFAGFATKVHGQTITPSITYQPEGKTVKAQTYREPVGVVAAITPWNSPLLMACMKLAPALAAGCSVVLKPAEATSLTALYLGKLLQQAGIPPGVVNIITGYGHEVGAHLASHADVNKISFTGSTSTGRALIQASSGNMKRLTLELGGKSPVVILPDADLDAAAAGIMRGSYANGGQVCVSGSRIYVARPAYEHLSEILLARLRSVRLGHGLDREVDMGALVSPEHAAKVSGYVFGDHGGEVLTGGQAAGPHASFVVPSLIAAPNAQSALMRDEVFGPVAAIIPFDELDEAIDWANDTSYGLAASVWTAGLSQAHRVADAIKAGTVWVNGHSYFSPELPKGGWGQSGWGVENNAEGLENYLQTKTVCMII
ncbi:MAG: aldehyde dehydrogenase family protein [Pseudomonadota bacterium]